MTGHDIIVIGASMGGVETLKGLVKSLPGNLPASLFVVQHTFPHAPALLGDILKRESALDCANAEDGEPIRQGRIYVAPPDYHLLLKNDHVRLSRGPRENRVRPAIDPLFRSAAVSCGPRTIGVILSGLQDDGSIGLVAVKRCGGIGIVQDPADAAFPEMPLSALKADHPDYSVPLSEMGGLLERLVSEPAGMPVPVPEYLGMEVKMTESLSGETEMETLKGNPALLTCPDCGGPLWETDNGGIRRYRCLVGHAFGGETLLAGKFEEIGRALWEAIRQFEERARLLRKMAGQARDTGREWSASDYEKKAEESSSNARIIRELVMKKAASS